MNHIQEGNMCFICGLEIKNKDKRILMPKLKKVITIDIETDCYSNIIHETCFRQLCIDNLDVALKLISRKKLKLKGYSIPNDATVSVDLND